MTSVTSEEVNYLIHRYLQEAGFVHSAFTFGEESLISRTEIHAVLVPPGMLVALLQKGLFYTSIEMHLNDDGSERFCSRPFSILEQHQCDETPNVNVENGHHAIGPHFTPTRPITPRTGPVVVAPLIDISSSSITNIAPQEFLQTGSKNLRKNVTDTGKRKRGKSTVNGDETEPAPVPAKKGRPVGPNKKGTHTTTSPSPSNGDMDEIAPNFKLAVDSNHSKMPNDGTSNHTDSVEPVSNKLNGHENNDAKLNQSHKYQHENKGSREKKQKSKKQFTETKTPDVDLPNNHSVPTIDTLMEIDRSDSSAFSNIPPEMKELVHFYSPRKLSGHTAEVIACAWNPTKHIRLLASASGDGTIRLWTIPGEGPWDSKDVHDTVRILDHTASTVGKKLTDSHVDKNSNIENPGGKDEPDQSLSSEMHSRHRQVKRDTDQDSSSQCDVTTLSWSQDGKFLASGAYDGIGRVWSADGDLLGIFDYHAGPIFQLQWSPDACFLVSVGVDPGAVLWRVDHAANTNSPDRNFVKIIMVRVLESHVSPVLDVDWHPRGNLFATCSTDSAIAIHSVNFEGSCLYLLPGHTDEVNSVRWSPDGTMLLSASDDHTARIWYNDWDQYECEAIQSKVQNPTDHSDREEIISRTLSPKTNVPCIVLAGHSLEIYTAKWNFEPSNIKDSENGPKMKQVATASFDGTIRLWEVEESMFSTSINSENENQIHLKVESVSIFEAHKQPVYAISFSPCGRFLASGSLDCHVALWLVKSLSQNVNKSSKTSEASTQNILRGTLLDKYECSGGVFEICWSKSGERLVAATADASLIIIDVYSRGNF